MKKREDGFFNRMKFGSKSKKNSESGSPITPLHPVNDNLVSPANSSFTDNLHPYAHLNAPSPISPNSNAILADEETDEPECPVCLEPLSFSFRLPGEKPHVIPLCGHALHDQCFAQVYGPLPSAKMPSKSLGVCGICRKPMKLSDDGDTSIKKTNKLDKLAGIVSPLPPPSKPSLQSSTSTNSLSHHFQKNNSVMSLSQMESKPPHDPLDSLADDPIPSATTNSSNTSLSNQSKNSFGELISPKISVQNEFNAAIRPNIDTKTSITAIVTISIPSRHDDSNDEKESCHPSLIRYQQRRSNILNDNDSIFQFKRSDSVRQSDSYSHRMSDNASLNSVPSTFSSLPQPPPNPNQSSNKQSLKSITADLYSRVVEWKNNNPHSFGTLLMFSSSLTIKRSSQSQSAQVYLFENAIICVSENRKSPPMKDGRKYLKLKGKIYISNIRRTLPVGDTALVLETEAEDFRNLTLLFLMKDERDSWKIQIDRLIYLLHNAHNQNYNVSHSSHLSQYSSSNFNSNLSAVKQGQYLNENGDSPVMLPKDYSNQVNHNNKLLSPQIGSSRNSGASLSLNTTSTPAMSPNSFNYSPRSTAPSSFKASSISTSGVSTTPSLPSDISAFGLNTHYNDELKARSSIRSKSSLPYQPDSISEQNIIQLQHHDGTLYPHAPADVILILPLPTSQHGSPTLKMRFLKSSLEFVINKLGNRDRICVVTFKSMLGGVIRRTPFVTTSSIQGKQKLSRFLETFGSNWEESVYGIDGTPDPFNVQTKDDERTDVVTAMNAALDGVLQRRTKNSITGIFLVSDNQDPTRRAQMELVLARAEAAAVPIHTLGWSRVHDPSSLWLLSSHTGGTYTFVKEWNQLRDCIAGVIGGLFSVAATNVKLHLNVLDWPMIKVRKVSPSTNTIVSSDGNEVHVELGELHFGEQRELLVEMDLIHPAKATIGSSGMNSKRLSRYSTQANVNSNIQDGLAGLSVGDTMIDAYDDLIDEAALFEVDASYHDPNLGRSVSRLLQPVLLTMTIHPNVTGDNNNNNNSPNLGSSPSSLSQKLNMVLGHPNSSIIRRRMELLSSDMITRALILISRKNYGQAQRLLLETTRLVQMAIGNLINTTSFSPTAQNQAMSVSAEKFKFDHFTLYTADILEAILFELENLLEGLEEQRESFEREQRNLGAQQAMILRDQKAWTGRSPIERLFWKFDNSRGLMVKSMEWNR